MEISHETCSLYPICPNNCIITNNEKVNRNFKVIIYLLSITKIKLILIFEQNCDKRKTLVEEVHKGISP